MRCLWIFMLRKIRIENSHCQSCVKSFNLQIILIDTVNCMRLCNHCSSENWNCMRYLWLYTLKKKQFENSHCQNYVKKVPSSTCFQETRKMAWDWSIFSIPEIKIACYICYFTSRIKNELGAHTYQMHAKQKFKTS